MTGARMETFSHGKESKGARPIHNGPDHRPWPSFGQE
jgi:hypothetical protein